MQPLVAEMLAASEGMRLKTISSQLRKKIRQLGAEGQDWRSAVDGLRPHTTIIWQAWTATERRRFLARLRPYWEVHRHRMAPDVARRFQKLCEEGLVRIVSGSVAAAHADNDGVRLFVRERGEERLLEIKAGRVINCTGPAAANSAEANPVIGSLLVHGWVQPDELRLGLQTTADGCVLDVHGEATPDLFVIGTLRKPALWETTAVPELRNQAAEIADRVLNGLSALEVASADHKVSRR